MSTLEIIIVLVTVMFIVEFSLPIYIQCVFLELRFNDIAALSSEIVLAHKRAVELHHLYLGDAYLNILCEGAIYGEVALCKAFEWSNGVGHVVVYFQGVLKLVELCNAMCYLTFRVKASEGECLWLAATIAASISVVLLI